MFIGLKIRLRLPELLTSTANLFSWFTFNVAFNCNWWWWRVHGFWKTKLSCIESQAIESFACALDSAYCFFDPGAELCSCDPQGVHEGVGVASNIKDITWILVVPLMRSNFNKCIATLFGPRYIHTRIRIIYDMNIWIYGYIHVYMCVFCMHVRKNVYIYKYRTHTYIYTHIYIHIHSYVWNQVTKGHQHFTCFSPGNHCLILFFLNPDLPLWT